MSYIIPFSELGKADIAVAGGKGANLGELTTAGFAVPAGVVLTTHAYNTFIHSNHLQQDILDLVKTAGSPASRLPAIAPKLMPIKRMRNRASATGSVASKMSSFNPTPVSVKNAT